MNKNAKTYALLVSNGNYREMEKENLPCYARDLAVIRQAISEGLKVENDNIRVLGENGTVTIRSFARAIAEFETLLRKEDTFLFYFSGHGQPKQLLFADGAVTIQSIVAFIDRLQARSKIVILDCCYSGAARVRSARPGAANENTDSGSIAARPGAGNAGTDSGSTTATSAGTSTAARLSAAGVNTDDDSTAGGRAAAYEASGPCESAPDISFEESVAVFSGSGIAVMASSAADSASWLADGGKCSLYTQVVAAAILSRRNIRAGKLALSDINEEIRYLMAVWNKSHPDKLQYPIYRDSMYGTICFQVEEYHPYVTQKITLETENYILQSVKPLSTGSLKRFAAFVITKNADDSLLPEITREIAGLLKNSDVYASKKSEQRFKGKPADAIWCYFGHDEGDLIRSNHFAYTIWAEKQEMRDLYFRENRNAEVTDGIYVYWNTSYGIVKDLQKTDTPDEKIIADYRNLENLLIAKAEEYRSVINEVDNGTVWFEDVRKNYQEWIREVRTLFFKLTDVPAAPLSSSRWSEAVMDLAGWVVDLAVLLESRNDWNDPGDRWMIRQTFRRYEKSLEALGEIERLSAQN